MLSMPDLRGILESRIDNRIASGDELETKDFSDCLVIPRKCHGSQPPSLSMAKAATQTALDRENSYEQV